MHLYATILAGGSGTRFWPVSRMAQPKQFLRLWGTESLLQMTLRRIAPLVPAARVHVVTAAHLQAQTAAQLPELLPAQLLSEPVGRNTAAAIGLAAWHIAEQDPEALMVVLPADHAIADSHAFCQSVHQAARAAQEARVLMTLGVQPTYPATGYGYIKAEASLAVASVPSALQVAQFTEKPNVETALRFVASASYFWNCGIFIWQVATILEELATHMPALWQGLQHYMTALRAHASAEELRRCYEQLPNTSIDYGVLEASARVGVLPVTWAWSDVGSWQALRDVHEPDQHSNVAVGPHLSYDSTGLVVYSPEKLVATLGVTDLIIVHTDDAILVCAKDRDQDVRELVRRLQERGDSAYL